MPTPTHPHLVFFNPDQFRADALGHLGNPAAPTPALDALVREDAVSFSHAYCQNPVCTPSRCSFMSGWYPHVRGHRTMYHMMRPDEPVLLRTLKESGYTVWWGGKNDLVPGQDGWQAYGDIKHFPGPGTYPGLHSDQSWRPAQGEQGYYSFMAGRLGVPEGQTILLDGDMATVQAACEFIRTVPLDKPLCIYLALLYPHPPYGVEEPFFSMIDREHVPTRIPAPSDWTGKPSLLRGIWKTQGLQELAESEWTELRATYLGMCARIDYQVSMVLDALSDRGIYDETAFFLLSDHGDFTGDYGLVEKTQNTFEECLTRVPFIVKPPANVPLKPGIRDALVELVDFPATVEALTGIEPRHTHFGQSLLPLISGQANQHRDAVFCEGGRLLEEEHTRERESTSAGDTNGLYWPRIKWQIGDGPEHGKATMCRTQRYKYVRRLAEQDELYDLQTDPEELYNRIGDPALAPVLARLKDRMLSFYQETADVVPFHPDEREFRR